MAKIVIIGNGIAGITAARHLRKHSNAAITVVSKESPYFFARTALMYVYMGQLRWKDTEPYEASFWKKNRIELIHDEVLRINRNEQCVHFQSQVLPYDQLILATGSRPRFYNWPGQTLRGVQGLYSKQDLEQLEALSPELQTAVVVGGGLIGVELTEMLLSRGKKVHFLIRESRFLENTFPKNDAELVMKRLSEQENLIVHYNTELAEIQGINNSVRSVAIRSGDAIACEFVGICTGVQANTELAQNAGLDVGHGILVNELLQTNDPNIFAIGDCAEHRSPPPGRSAIEQAWYTGRGMGETVAKTIAGHPTSYAPGQWFNSAKFFDLEYQTYGNVPNQPDDHCAFFEWQHPVKAVRMTFAHHTVTHQFLGVNTFGIRLRHELIEYWLDTSTSLDVVITSFKSAQFDPEFYTSFAGNILETYNRQFHTSHQLAPATWWKKLLTRS